MWHPPVGGSSATDWWQGRRSGNIAALLSDNIGRKPVWILNNAKGRRILADMKHMRLLWVTALLFSFAATAGTAECFADYKAKRDNPLRLHYGVVQIAGPCSAAEARAEIAARLERNGWTLLNVVSLFDRSGLEERQRSAGQYYLRF
jgi:hypothetical protein